MPTARCLTPETPVSDTGDRKPLQTGDRRGAAGRPRCQTPAGDAGEYGRATTALSNRLRRSSFSDGYQPLADLVDVAAEIV
jgi:hypothetical protein